MPIATGDSQVVDVASSASVSEGRCDFSEEDLQLAEQESLLYARAQGIAMEADHPDAVGQSQP